MTLRRFVKKLPAVLQTEVQKEFYAATFDQLFNPANVESAQGFIGRRSSDVLDPLVDNYLDEPSKNRAAYQLEPIAYAVNAALEDVNHFFYDDLINYIRHRGGNVDNHSRLFADSFYSFAPPIDVDKYLNYQNYLWLPGDGSDPTNTPPIGFIFASDTWSPADFDTAIETQIIGATSFNTSQIVRSDPSDMLSPEGSIIPTNFELTSGVRLQFVGSASYNKPFYIEGVGRSIRLVEEEDVIYPSTDVDITLDSPSEPTLDPAAPTNILATPDYITVERGSNEGSAWSRSNRWFHEDAVDAITTLGQLQSGTVINPGNGYEIGDVLSVNIGDGINGSFVVTSIGLGGTIEEVAVYQRGSGYTFAAVDQTGSISSVSDLLWDDEDPFGLGAKWDPDNVAANASGYLTIAAQDETDFDEAIIGGTISLGGTNYNPGDILTIVGGTGTAATFTVDTVDGVSGAVTGISLLSAGSYSAIPTTPAETTVLPAGGTGCFINLEINGLFDGGSGWTNPADVNALISLTDGSIVRIDALSGAVVSEFTILSSSSELQFSSGNTLTMGGIDGEIRVVINSSNELASCHITKRGSGYFTGGVMTLNNTLGGTGGQITYTVADGKLDTVSVTTAGSGYTYAGDDFNSGVVVSADMPVTSDTNGSGTGFELTLNSANERGVSLWDDNTITLGAGAGCYIEGNLATAVSRSLKGTRPILEFKRDLDMYDMGSRYFGAVDVAAATESFGDIQSQAVGLQVDGVTLETGMKLIFLDPDTIASFLTWDTAIPMANDYSSVTFNDLSPSPDTIVRTGGTAFDSELSPGDFVQITNAVVPANNGTYEVALVDPTTITLVAGGLLVTDAVDSSAILSKAVPTTSDWDVDPWEVSGLSGATTRFVWEVDASSPNIQLNKYDLINEVAGDVPVDLGGVVTVKSGDAWAGHSFYQTYNTLTDEFYWRAGQQKYSTNQAMLYNLYDTSGYSLNDSLEYPDSDFVGNEIFSYKVLTQARLNELGGGALIDDSVLGFPVETKGFRQLGDILFENDLETERSNYTPVGESETEIRGYYYYKQYVVSDLDGSFPNINNPDSTTNYNLLTNWKSSTAIEEQRVIDRYLTTTDDEDIFDVSVSPPQDNETCLVVAQGRRLNTTEYAYLSSIDKVQLFAKPTEYSGLVSNGTSAAYTFIITDIDQIQLTIDGVYQEKGIDYTVDEINSTPGSVQLLFDSPVPVGSFMQATNRASGAPGAGEVVEVMTCSNDALPADSIGYFEIPNGLENNPNNEEILEQSWNEFTPHFTSIITEQEVYEGDAFGSGNNYRDTLKDGSLGTFALQSQSPMLKTMLCSANGDLDIIDSIRFNKEEYTRFKNKYVKTAQQLLNEGFTAFNDSNPIDVSEWVDEILRRVTRGREYADAFSDTYMIAWSNAYQEQEILGTGTATAFTTTNFVDLEDKRNVMYVYVDGVIQIVDQDYEIVNTNPIQIEMTTAPSLGASVVIRLYENSASAHIPATPTKLGLYPAVRPEIVTDNTYLTPAQVIIGHDGSRTPIYGNEIDDLLIELETRIYNGILEKFRRSTQSGDIGTYTTPLDYHNYKPGKFRDTRWSLKEWNDLIKQSFFKWSASNRTDYITNSYYDSTNEWSYNYKTVEDVDGELLTSGYWRGIFDYYYDTQTPESTPWEMLGFVDQPIWWEATTPRGDGWMGYGAGPWPDTHQMWEDIEAGLIRRVYDPIDGEEDISDSTFDYWIMGEVDERYARPDLVANYLPVDGTGALKADPLLAIDTTASLTLPSSAEAEADYSWSDWSPIEYAWRTSESFPFALMEALFLARPGEFGEKFWDPEHIYEVPVDRLQIVNDENDLRKRIGNDSLYVHGESVGGVPQVNSGYQVWITARLRTLKKDPSVDFGALLRTLDVKLGHKMAGFTDKDTLRVFVEGISVSSQATNLLIPSENIDVALYTGAPANDYFYGGVLIKALANDTYQVFGYDVLKGEFEYYGRDDKIGTRSINVGGQPEEFQVYENNKSYITGQIVKLNGIFYKSLENQDSTSFDPVKWNKLNALPISGGINATWKATSDGVLNTLQYGEKIVGYQALLDFLAGWSDYLVDQGWSFEELSASSVINDWEKIGKDFLLWVSSSWEEGSLIMLSPGGEKAVLNAQEGYPGNVERISNGVYSILNKEGVAIDPINTVINREDRLIEIEPSIDQTGIYGLRVSTYETENIITFDNVTVFNDILYDPVLGSRLARLDFRGRRTLDWTGKLEAAGFIITADGLLPNYENLVDSIRNYHNTEVQLDRPDLENTARHLIGFDERSYFTDLGILDDAQFQFYQGLVRQKGTKQAIDKLERNALVTSVNDQLNVVEEWALKLGEFGGVCKNQYTEFLIAASEVKVDPQLVQLSYPASSTETRDRSFASADVSVGNNTITVPSHGLRTGDGKIYSIGTGTVVDPLTDGGVYYVIVVDDDTLQLATTRANAVADTAVPIVLTSAGTGTTHRLAEYPSGKVTSVFIVSSGKVYNAAPTVFFTNHPDDTTGSGAAATAVLDTDGTLLRIDLLSQGEGYSEPPLITISNPVVAAGDDRAVARITYDITTDITTDDVILIDSDDESRWITKPAGSACDVAAELWPEAAEGRYRTTNAGYVHKDDVDFTAFNVAAIDTITSRFPTALEHGQLVWIARDPSEEFGVYFLDNYRASTIDAQTEVDFDGATDTYGSFEGGTDYGASERIIMSDGTEILVDTVSSGVVTEFTIDKNTNDPLVTGIPFPARGSHTLTAVSSNGSGDNNFTLTVGTHNEEGAATLDGYAATATITDEGVATLTSLPREDVINAQFTITVGGAPSGQVTSVSITNGGFGYTTDGTFTISRDTHGSERTTNAQDAVISYTVMNGEVVTANVATAGTEYGRNVDTAVVNTAGSGYNIDDVLTVTDGTPIGPGLQTTLDVIELTTIAQDETSFDASPANEGTFDAGTGHVAGDVITLTDGSTVTVDAATVSTIKFQTHADFDGVGSNGTIVSGSAVNGDIVTMSDGTQIQITVAGTPAAGPNTITEFKIIESTTATNLQTGDTITQVSTSGFGVGFTLTLGTNNEQTTADVGLVKEFTITTTTTTGITENSTVLEQESTTGAGSNFALNMGVANQGVYGVSIDNSGSYSTQPTLSNSATTVAPTGGSGATLDLTMIGDNIPVNNDDVNNPIGYGRYLGNTVPDAGKILIDGTLYEYEIISGLSVSLKKNGVNVEEGTFADGTPFFTLMNTRYQTSTIRTLFEPAMTFIGIGKTWLDGGTNGWEVSDFTSPSTYAITRSQQPLIETYKFENAYVYDELTKDTLAQIPVYDPFKGILPGTAAQNLEYIRQRDPARYTTAVASGETVEEAAINASRLVDEDLAFDGDQLGQLWWDTSTCAYLYYEQGTDRYRRDNWGKLFTGSSVDVYEWSRSSSPPASWTGDGTVYSTTNYTQKDEWDPINEEVRTFYYFWVKNRTEIPGGVNRTVAAFEVANIITNPVANLYQWFSPTSQSSFVFAGVDNVFTDSNNIFQINYRRDDTERPLHVEWELGRDSDNSYDINQIHWNKMVDSLCGFTDEVTITADAYTDTIASFNTDATGVDAPSNNLITTTAAHGLTNGAGVVYSKGSGTENVGLTDGVTYYVEVVSDTVIALHPQARQALPIPPAIVNPASRASLTPNGTEVHTLRESSTALNNFANAIPTASDPERGYLVVPDPTLSDSQQLGIRTRPMQSMFLNLQDARRVWRDKVNELTSDMILRDIAPTWNADLTTNNLWEWVDWYEDGYDEFNTIPVRQVDDTSDLASLPSPLNGDLVKVTGTRYSIYEYDADAAIYNLVAREASRLNILEDVYTSAQSLEIAIELREIIQALEDNVFTGQLSVYSNVVFFSMLNYVFSEQQDLDWAFKTTYIFLDQTGRTLEQDRVFQEDPFDAALEYITEAKPYHSKVRDFRITRKTATDEAAGTALERHRQVTSNGVTVDIPYDMTVNMLVDQIRGGNLSVTEMRIAKYMMAQDNTWNGYTTLFEIDGTPTDVRLGAAGRGINSYRELLTDIQGPTGGTKATFEVEITGGLLVDVDIIDGGSGYTADGSFTLVETSATGTSSGATIDYLVTNGIIVSAAVTNTGANYADGVGISVDADDVPTPATGTTLGEFNPVYTGAAITELELIAVGAINEALTDEFFYDYQGSLLINTSFGGLPTLDEFALVLDEEGNTAAGTGYVLGEILTLDAGSGVPVSNALFRVTAVTGSGGITSLDLVSGGSYTQTPTVDPVDLLGGSGSSAQVTTLIFENGSAIPFDSVPWDQVGFESSAQDEAVISLTGSPDGLATTIPGQQAGDYDGVGENGSFDPGLSYVAGNGSNDYTDLAFNNLDPDTIVRNGGTDFLTDGFAVGQQIIVSNSENSGENDGTYTITDIDGTGTTITLEGSSSLVDNLNDSTATIARYDVATMTDNTKVRIDSVDGSGSILGFTIIEGSEAYLPLNSTITQLSVSGSLGSGFQLALGAANETSGTFADIEAEETFSGTGNQKEFFITTDTPTYFMFAVVNGVEQVLNVDYFFIGTKLTFVSYLDAQGDRNPGAPPAGTDNVELYTYIEAGDLINPQVTAGITEEMVPLDPRENLVVLADTHNVALNAAGTGYAVGEILTVVGGTFTTAMTLVVTAETGGAIDSVVVRDSGEYTVLPGVGAAVTSDLAGNDDATIDVTEFPFSFRLHNDTLNNMIFTRNTTAASAELTSNISVTSNSIPIDTPANLPDATRADPQVAWIGTERIVYHGKTATELTGVIRGSQGTHAQAAATGTKVYDGGENQYVPVTPYIYWTNSATTDVVATGVFDGEWRYHGNNLVHFMQETTASNIHSDDSLLVGDTLRCLSGSYIQNSYYIIDLIEDGEISKLDVTDVGTGYSVGDVISVADLDNPGTGLGSGGIITSAVLEVGGVDVNGGITHVCILDRGEGYDVGSLNFPVSGGNGDATITVYTDREGLALAIGGDIISPSGVVVARNNVDWTVDRALPGGLTTATTPAAIFLNGSDATTVAGSGNAIRVDETGTPLP